MVDTLNAIDNVMTLWPGETPGINLCVLFAVIVLLRELYPQKLKLAIMRNANYNLNTYSIDRNFYEFAWPQHGILAYWKEAFTLISVVMLFAVFVPSVVYTLFIIVLILITIVELIFSIILYYRLGKKFDKSIHFTVGMCIFPFPFVKYIAEHQGCPL